MKKEPSNLGMQTFDQALFDAYEANVISYEDALRNADSTQRPAPADPAQQPACHRPPGFFCTEHFRDLHQASVCHPYLSAFHHRFKPLGRVFFFNPLFIHRDAKHQPPQLRRHPSRRWPLGFYPW